MSDTPLTSFGAAEDTPTEGFTPLWLVLARHMVRQCRRCGGSGEVPRGPMADDLDPFVRCPDCKELRELVTPAGSPQGVTPAVGEK